MSEGIYAAFSDNIMAFKHNPVEYAANARGGMDNPNSVMAHHYRQSIGKCLHYFFFLSLVLATVRFSAIHDHKLEALKSDDMYTY